MLKYLEHNKVETVLNTFLNSLVHSKPSNPFSTLGSILDKELGRKIIVDRVDFVERYNPQFQKELLLSLHVSYHLSTKIIEIHVRGSHCRENKQNPNFKDKGVNEQHSFQAMKEIISKYLVGKNVSNYWTFSSIMTRIIESPELSPLQEFFKGLSFLHYELCQKWQEISFSDYLREYMIDNIQKSKVNFNPKIMI